ncbi:MAG: hypothetical protein O3A36_03495 [bacterium]|nr:hypothetical protein [bacterium]
MKKYTLGVLIISCLCVAFPANAALLGQVNSAFQSVHGRIPTYLEWEYWANRVLNKEKTTYEALVGAMGYQKVNPTGAVLASISPVVVPGVATFIAERALYASPYNPNFLPDGMLVRNTSKADIFYIQDGKKSVVLPNILARWFGEAHFFKGDFVITVTDADLARYPLTTAVNPLYIGKVLQHPDGTQFYIDDKMRKRPMSAAVRTALKFPGKNLYPTTASHLTQFKTGPALTGSKQPGGMIIYDGGFHGGRIWRLEEASDGVITKRLYLGDYFYEAEYYPDESQRVQVSATELASYRRGANISKYPDGWVVSLNSQRYVFQDGKLRLIGSNELFNAFGYNSRYVLTAFSQFYSTAAHGQPIGAFKKIIAPNIKLVGTLKSSPSSAANLIKVRPDIRTLISTLNAIALPIYDREITVAENSFWIDWLYNGEAQSKDQLLAAMKKHAATKKFPVRTSRTAELSEDILQNKWFPYLFYFVHQKEPNDDDRDYWFDRINGSDRNTIEKLGGTLQWLKDTSGLTHK